MNRRQLIRAALAAGVIAAPLGVAAGRAVADIATGPVQLVLPWPRGPFPVGTATLHLAKQSRELMGSLWYPARDVARYPRVPYMPDPVLRLLAGSAGFDPDIAAAPLTAAHLGAPAIHGGEGLPLVLFSHGAHGHRAEETIVVQELASHGYAVLTIDHNGDAFTQLSDGRVLTPDPALPMGPPDFAADILFVLDRVKTLAAIYGVRLDMDRVGMFGWSKGATATALVMHADPRVRAGLSLDAPMQPVMTFDLDRPFMLMTAEFGRDAEPAVAEFWSHLRGWRLNVQADGAVHRSYGDYQALVPQLAAAAGLSDADLREWVGTLDPGQAVRIQQAYPLAFFEQHLRGRRQRLLDGPSREFPEVRFIA